MKYLFLLIFIPLSSFASIFETDDRLEFYQLKDEKVRDLTRSTPALIPKERLRELPSGDYEIVADNLIKSFKLCEDANFSHQKLVANCSAALIKDNQILTAAHCLDVFAKDRTKAMDKYYVVFDYKMTKKDERLSVIPSENVFTLKNEVFFNFDQSMFKTAVDLAIYELDRKANRPALKVNTQFSYEHGTQIFIIGYPLGIMQKVGTNGYIDRVQNAPNSFRHDLDAFSVNSGSPIFDVSTHEIIGVHVRGTGPNTKSYERECTDWYRAISGKDFDEANMLHILKSVITN